MNGHDLKLQRCLIRRGDWRRPGWAIQFFGVIQFEIFARARCNLNLCIAMPQIGDWVYYTGSWTGERPEDGLQYFANKALVVEPPGKKLLKLIFSDGLMLRTQKYSRDQPLLPGHFRVQQQVYYSGAQGDREGRLYFGEDVTILGRVNTAWGSDLMVRRPTGGCFKTSHRHLTPDIPFHQSGYHREQAVWYTGSAVNKHLREPMCYYGYPARIISFLKDTEVVLIRFGEDFEIRTSKISIYRPKLLGSDFYVGDELYYTGQRERLHGKRATIVGLLPSEPDPDNRVLVQFRNGDTVKTRPGRLQRTKPETPRHSQGQPSFMPPQRVAFEMPSSASTSRIPLEDIYYSQDSIKQSFQDGQTLEKMKRQLIQGVKTVTDIPRITVVRHQGRWFSVDNRRLWVFKQVYSGTKAIPICQGVQDHRFWNKFTTNNGGRQIRLRWSVIKYPLSPLRAYNTEAEGLLKRMDTEASVLVMVGSSCFKTA